MIETITSQPVLLAVVIFAGAALAARYGVKKDTEIEDRRRAANRVAGLLRAKGMVHIPEFLEDYGVGDYSGMGSKMKKAAILLTDGGAAEKEFDAAFDRALAVKLQDSDWKAIFLSKVQAPALPSK